MRWIKAAFLRVRERTGLAERVVTIGHRRDWLLRLVTLPECIGTQIGVPVTALPKERLIEQLKPIQLTFIKWDARPGNAVVQTDDSVAWFDWEHCGVRNALDDLAWLLCDEYTPDWPAVEARLLDQFLPVFARSMTIETARDYLFTMSTFHSCVRLSLILTNKSDGPWWDAERCLESDSIGVTLEAALRVCERGARWAREGSRTGKPGNWFANATQLIQAA